MQKTDLAQKYQHKTAREHCLDAPDTYIGSVEEEEQETKEEEADVALVKYVALCKLT